MRPRFAPTILRPSKLCSRTTRLCIFSILTTESIPSERDFSKTTSFQNTSRTTFSDTQARNEDHHIAGSLWVQLVRVRASTRTRLEHLLGTHLYRSAACLISWVQSHVQGYKRWAFIPRTAPKEYVKVPKFLGGKQTDEAVTWFEKVALRILPLFHAILVASEVERTKRVSNYWVYPRAGRNNVCTWWLVACRR